MDTLALLCNLLAEGPATLRVLHREGVKTLSDVEAQRIDHLASLLGASPAGARRFAGEARMLAARMGTAPLEREQNAPFLSAESPEESPRFSPMVPRSGEPARTSPTNPLAAPGTPLRPEAIEGLDAQLCEQLAREGIRTFEALGEASGLSLARRLGLGLPRLLDLAYLARCRSAGAATTAAAAGHSEPYFLRQPRHSARPEAQPRKPLIAGFIERDADVSGPFV